MSDEAQIPADQDVIAQVEAILADPRHRDDPLRSVLERLFVHSQGQRQRLERLVRISDGYHSLSRDQNQSLERQYDRQLHRLEKLARISDRYQNSLREMSEALREASLRDPLTELGNRRFLMERLDEETERANRKASSYVIGILDVDYFKTINDRFGHETGDRALFEIASAIRRPIREYDLCGRWGGEEFLILLPETTLEQGRETAERIAQAVRDIRLEGLDVGITVSIGLSAYRLGETHAAALNRADAALLAAKSAGRDRIELG